MLGIRIGDALSAVVLFTSLGLLVLTLSNCTTDRMTGQKTGPIAGYSQQGSIGWNWNQTPHGGSDEKSSQTPEESP